VREAIAPEALFCERLYQPGTVPLFFPTAAIDVALKLFHTGAALFRRATLTGRARLTRYCSTDLRHPACGASSDPWIRCCFDRRLRPGSPDCRCSGRMSCCLDSINSVRTPL